MFCTCCAKAFTYFGEVGDPTDQMGISLISLKNLSGFRFKIKRLFDSEKKRGKRKRGKNEKKKKEKKNKKKKKIKSKENRKEKRKRKRKATRDLERSVILNPLSTSYPAG